VHFADEPLEYTGTGKELFLGFLIAIGVIFIPLFLFGLASALLLGPRGSLLAQIVIYPALLYLTGVAIYRARRYRLTRTSWRGIRGSQEGNSWGFGWTYFWTAALIPAVAVLAIIGLVVARSGGQGLQMGLVGAFASPWLLYGLLFVTLIAWLWLVPWRATKLQRHMTNDMAFGDRLFRFTGSARPLYARFVARWIGVVVLAIGTVVLLAYTHGDYAAALREAQLTNRPPPSLSTARTLLLIAILMSAFVLYSIITAWYAAAQANIFAAATHFDKANFRLDVSAIGLIGLFLTNFLLMLFTIGILKPVVEARAARYFVERLSLEGNVDLKAIGQSSARLGRSGEGLAQAFDVDAF
jgi:uncharacterized membrane protein YjgN (DUF898 family)